MHNPNVFHLDAKEKGGGGKGKRGDKSLNHLYMTELPPETELTLSLEITHIPTYPNHSFLL